MFIMWATGFSQPSPIFVDRHKSLPEKGVLERYSTRVDSSLTHRGLVRLAKENTLAYFASLSVRDKKVS